MQVSPATSVSPAVSSMSSPPPAPQSGTVGSYCSFWLPGDAEALRSSARAPTALPPRIRPTPPREPWRGRTHRRHRREVAALRPAPEEARFPRPGLKNLFVCKIFIRTGLWTNEYSENLFNEFIPCRQGIPEINGNLQNNRETKGKRVLGESKQASLLKKTIRKTKDFELPEGRF